MSERVAAIRSLYFGASKATIESDFDEAIDLLKAMASEEERDRAAVYMEGLAQMKAQWRPKVNRPSRASGAPQSATRPGRSGRSKSAGRRPR
jgi:predicted RecB family endonuclease